MRAVASDPELVGWTDPADPQGRILPASMHPALMRAAVAADDVATVWRMQYEMPPTDPRYLDADDDVVVHDLAVLLYYRRSMEAAVNPAAAALRSAKGDPNYGPDLIARNLAWLRSAQTQHRLRHVLGRDRDTAVKAKNVRMRRKKP